MFESAFGRHLGDGETTYRDWTLVPTATAAKAREAEAPASVPVPNIPLPVPRELLQSCSASALPSSSRARPQPQDDARVGRGEAIMAARMKAMMLDRRSKTSPVPPLAPAPCSIHSRRIPSAAAVAASLSPPPAPPVLGPPAATGPLSAASSRSSSMVAMDRSASLTSSGYVASDSSGTSRSNLSSAWSSHQGAARRVTVQPRSEEQVRAFWEGAVDARMEKLAGHPASRRPP